MKCVVDALRLSRDAERGESEQRRWRQGREVIQCCGVPAVCAHRKQNKVASHGRLEIEVTSVQTHA